MTVDLDTVAGLTAAFREQADRAQVEWEGATKISPYEPEICGETTWLRYAADFMERKLAPLDATVRRLTEENQQLRKRLDEQVRAYNHRTIAQAILDRYAAGDTVGLLAADYGWTIAEVAELVS